MFKYFVLKSGLFRIHVSSQSILYDSHLSIKLKVGFYVTLLYDDIFHLPIRFEKN